MILRNDQKTFSRKPFCRCTFLDHFQRVPEKLIFLHFHGPGTLKTPSADTRFLTILNGIQGKRNFLLLLDILPVFAKRSVNNRILRIFQKRCSRPCRVFTTCTTFLTQCGIGIPNFSTQLPSPVGEFVQSFIADLQSFIADREMRNGA